MSSVRLFSSLDVHVLLLFPLAGARSPRDVVFTESRSGPPPTLVFWEVVDLAEKHPKLFVYVFHTQSSVL